MQNEMLNTSGLYSQAASVSLPSPATPSSSPSPAAPSLTTDWPSVTYEMLPWERSDEDLAYISKTARRKITPTYEAAIPACIANAQPVLAPDLAARTEALLIALARFDVEQATRGYNLPALLLRSESAASSQIEHLTSSVRNVALAELTGAAPHNALAIAGNIAAMRAALALPANFGIPGVCAVHRALNAPTGQAFAGHLREEQVWVGGTPYSPHGALFVPPAYARVVPCLEDLLAFARRQNVNPVVRAAIVHAQFETIHPFVDGNGRTGRTLVHKLLCESGVTAQVTLPMSAGLLHNVDAYMAALRAYQQGDVQPIVVQLVKALELALALSRQLAQRVDEVFAAWEAAVPARKGASIHALPRVLAEQPVVNAAYLAERLSITPRAANNLIDKACEYGVLARIGGGQRNVSYQAPALIAVLEEASSTAGIRRLLAKS